MFYFLQNVKRGCMGKTAFHIVALIVLVLVMKQLASVNTARRDGLKTHVKLVGKSKHKYFFCSNCFNGVYAFLQLN